MPLSASYWSRLSTDPTRYPSMRASDEDRNVVFDALGEAYAQGLLTSEEHAERMELAGRIRTLEQIPPLITDVVEAPAQAETPTTDLVTTSGADLAPLDYEFDNWREGLTHDEIEEIDRQATNSFRKSFIVRATSLSIPIALCLVIFFITGYPGMFWPVFILWFALPALFQRLADRKKLMQKERFRLARRKRAQKFGITESAIESRDARAQRRRTTRDGQLEA